MMDVHIHMILWMQIDRVLLHFMNSYIPSIQNHGRRSKILQSKSWKKDRTYRTPKLPAIFDHQKSVVLEQGLDREIAEASSIYSFFTKNITNLIGRYASEDYTDNHMKILATVTLMKNFH